ncbi:MAG: hypothetical protein ACRENS_05285, partial [Candidatus Eiseniibacteriota bacterium]
MSLPAARRTSLWWIAATCGLAACVAVSGAQAAAPADSSAATGPASVELAGRPLFTLSAPFKSLSASERAGLASARLEKLARDPQFLPESLSVVESDYSSDIVSGDRIAFAVMDADTLGTGLNRQALAAQRARIVRDAMTRYSSDYSARSLLWA